MRPCVVTLAIALLVGLSGCGTFHPEVVRIPERTADVYPTAQANAEVAVAVDPITQSRRAERYFGADLQQGGILPINITVSNYGQHRIRVQPADILLHRGGQVVDPLPVEMVTEEIHDAGLRTSFEAGEELREYVGRITFGETVVMPQDTYHGVLFFDLGQNREERFSKLNIIELFSHSRYQVDMKVTDMDTNRRLGFGPFLVGY